MLSNKFIVIVVVVIVVVIGFAMFPAFNTMFRSVNTTGMDTETTGIARLFPYFMGFVILYAGYMIFRRGK